MEGPAQIDLDDRQQVIQHFRDLILLSSLIDYDLEISKFIRLLQEHGWDSSLIDYLITRAGQGTYFEELIDSPIPTNGDYREYQRNKSRCRK